jgi:hypothetical protein
MKRVAVIAALVVSVVAAGSSVWAQSYADGYMAGREAGRKDCDGTDYFLRGVIGGIIYIGYAVVAPPNSPPDYRLGSIASATAAYQEGYIAGYEKEWQSCRLRNAIFGATSWLFFYLILAGMI